MANMDDRMAEPKAMPSSVRRAKRCQLIQKIAKLKFELTERRRNQIRGMAVRRFPNTQQEALYDNLLEEMEGYEEDSNDHQVIHLWLELKEEVEAVLLQQETEDYIAAKAAKGKGKKGKAKYGKEKAGKAGKAAGKVEDAKDSPNVKVIKAGKDTAGKADAKDSPSAKGSLAVQAGKAAPSAKGSLEVQAGKSSSSQFWQYKVIQSSGQDHPEQPVVAQEMPEQPVVEQETPAQPVVELPVIRPSLKVIRPSCKRQRLDE